MGWGDELMAAGEAQAKAAGRDIKVAIKDRNGQVRWHDAWENHPLIARPGQPYQDSITNGPGVRSYTNGVHAGRWVWRKYTPVPADIYFSEAEKKFASSLGSGFVVIEPNLKGKKESVNRDWGWDKWQALVKLMPKVQWVQLGPAGTRTLRKVRFIQTDTPRLMAAALSKAVAFVAPEGGLHHTAAAVRVPGVVIHGHFNSAGVTGYPGMVHLSTEELGCGSQLFCRACRDAMEAITPEAVAGHLQTILDQAEVSDK